MIYRTIFCLLIMTNLILAQGLFENTLQDEQSSEPSGLNYELNGYIRGGAFTGPVAGDRCYESKSVYGESALKLRVRKGHAGNAFAEIRLRRDANNEQCGNTAELREGYVNAYMGPFDVRIGQQIVVWGKADGYNPTNTITPLDLLVFSPDEDDRRNSNFVIRSFWNGRNISLETIWIPVYEPSVLPFSRVKLDNGLQLGDAVYPDHSLKNNGGAIKLHYDGASIDGSISYFKGYFPMPGISAAKNDNKTNTIYPEAYRTEVIGADFSTTCGKYGLRGEFALKNPDKKETYWQSIPNKQFEYIFGIDRDYGHFSLIVQYIGKHVFDYDESDDSDASDIQKKVRLWNRMISMQLKERCHSLSFRPAWTLLHETLNVEILGQVCFKTREKYFKPKVTYDLTDDLHIGIGAQWYSGPEETLYGQIDDSINACFIELKTTF